MGNINALIQMICVAAIPLIFAITLHEAAHGLIASKLGDQTARAMGRVSLNPIRHIDLFGTILLPLIMLSLSGFIFGWAKPVPVVWKNLNRPKRDMALVALAGPGANLVMALLWALIAKITHLVFLHPEASPVLQSIGQFLHLTSRFGVMINCVLLVINLIPIPPLDGSRVVTSILPIRAAIEYSKLEPYGLWIFLGLLAFLYATQSMMLLWMPIVGLIKLIYVIFGL